MSDLFQMLAASLGAFAIDIAAATRIKPAFTGMR
jgi:hypothetical protein